MHAVLNVKRLVRALATAVAVLLLSLQPALAAGLSHEEKSLPGEGALPYLFAGFTVAVIGLAGYLLYLHSKDVELRRELESLREDLMERRPRRRP